MSKYIYEKTEYAITADFVSVTFVSTSRERSTKTFLRGENPALFKRALASAQSEDFEALGKLSLNLIDNIEEIDVRFRCTNGVVTFDGNVVDNFVTKKIAENFRDGRPIKHWIAFLKNTMSNPHAITVDDIYRFLEDHEGCPITEDGAILAYKKVGKDYRSFYASSKTGEYEYWKPGSVVELPRNECDSDRNNTCSAGLHFCSRKYLPSFYGDSGRVVMVKIFPQDIVAIPIEYENAKGRCCRATVLRDIPDLETFAFGCAYTADGEESAYADEDYDADSSMFKHVEKRIREYVFWSLKNGAKDSKCIADFISDVYNFCTEQHDYGFIYDEEDVLHVLENSEDPIIRENTCVRTETNVFVDIS